MSVDDAEVLRRIRQWQTFQYVTPMVCALDRTHGKLKPKKQDGRIVLICPAEGCLYETVNIPEYFRNPGFELRRGVGLVITSRGSR